MEGIKLETATESKLLATAIWTNWWKCDDESRKWSKEIPAIRKTCTSEQMEEAAYLDISNRYIVPGFETEVFN